MTGMYPVVYVALKVKQKPDVSRRWLGCIRWFMLHLKSNKTGCIPPMTGMYPVVYVALKVKQNRIYPADDWDGPRGLCFT